MDRRNFLKNSLALSGAIAGCGSWLYFFQPAAALRGLLRPPGALPEAEFLGRCIQCLRCVDACPNHAIIPFRAASNVRSEDTPVIKPRRQACMLCNAVKGRYLRCTDICPTGALQRVKKTPDAIQKSVAMGTAEIDRVLCYSYNNWICGSCYRACPFPGKAMTLGLWEKPEVHSEACIGCGACERACISYPQAIRVRRKV